MSNITVKSSEARAKFRDLLDQVMTGKGDVVIERNGRSVAVLISAENYEQIRERLAAIRAIREAAATYEAMKSSPARINAEEGTATIPLDLYARLVAEREARFEVIRQMQEDAPDLSEEEVNEIVTEAIQKVRADNATSRA